MNTHRPTSATVYAYSQQIRSFRSVPIRSQLPPQAALPDPFYTLKRVTSIMKAISLARRAAVTAPCGRLPAKRSRRGERAVRAVRARAVAVVKSRPPPPALSTQQHNLPHSAAPFSQAPSSSRRTTRTSRCRCSACRGACALSERERVPRRLPAAVRVGVSASPSPRRPAASPTHNTRPFPATQPPSLIAPLHCAQPGGRRQAHAQADAVARRQDHRRGAR